MARTAVDLPDPLQAQGGTAAGNASAAGNADDLLAQLAGEEVDRLLSEADVPLPAAAAATPQPPQPAAPAAPPASSAALLDNAVSEAAQATLDDLFEEIDDVPESGDAANVPATAASKPAGAAPGKVSSATLRPATAAAVASPGAEELIAEVRREAAEVPPAVGAPPTPSAAEALAAEMEEDERTHAAAIRRMKHADPATLPPTEIDEDEESDVGDAVAEQESGEGELRVPLLVRALEWVNAPLAGLPETVRIAIGKVALITSLNALGVIAYVLIFRRHGHG